MFGFNMFPMIPRTFVCDYACFSIAMLPGNEREDVERGGKIIMPPSALEQLTRLNINYPMLFKLTNRLMDRVTHSGVLEFVADEGKVYLPHWMMRNLMLNEGESVIIENVSMPVATYSKFQPQSPEFLDISNPKAVLENCLRNFACLTTGDTINIKYNSKDYELFVIETQPGKAVTIIECDMNVEFASPVGYQEPNAPDNNFPEDMEMEDAPVECSKGFMAFTGIGHRLDGKGRKPDFVTNGVFGGPRRGVPDYEYDYVSLTFLRNVRPLKKPVVEVPEFKPFEGDGNILNPKKLGK